MRLELINFNEIPFETQLHTLEWRNSESVSEFFKIKQIDEKTHRKWLLSLKQNSPLNIAFIIKVNSSYVGVTYFHSIDYEKRQCDWGIYIYDNSNRGKGLGSIVLKEILKYAARELNMNKVFLDVKFDNAHAIKLYEKYGFKVEKKDGAFLRYVNDLTLINS